MDDNERQRRIEENERKIDQIQERMLKRAISSTRLKINQGVYYLALRQKLGKRKFREYLEEEGIESLEACEHMALYIVYDQRPRHALSGYERN